MKKENLKKQYRDLELKVYRALRDKIEESNYISPNTNTKAIRVNMGGFTELALENDRMVFKDFNEGIEKSVYETPLDNLMDLLDRS